jgi:hypothetical protein
VLPFGQANTTILRDFQALTGEGVELEPEDNKRRQILKMRRSRKECFLKDKLF